jgi:hypothetical protein
MISTPKVHTTDFASIHPSKKLIDFYAYSTTAFCYKRIRYCVSIIKMAVKSSKILTETETIV